MRAAAALSPRHRPAASAKEIAIACGPGGVGKTTTAAAVAAMAAAEHGGRVLVLTVDPAKRLADALGLKGIGNDEVRIDDEVFKQAGVAPRGELWAAMLDTKLSWDDLIRRHAPDEATREEILANPLYQNISGRFVQSHDYIAMERLYEIHSEGKYDLIVVDTPPTRNALDFLDAPQRMADFFSSRLLRWLIVPYRSRLVNVATKPFYQVADRILGTQFLADISEFFILFQSMHKGFVERADAVTRLLSDRRTTFMVVSTLEATPLREAEFFSAELDGAQTAPGRHRSEQGAARLPARRPDGQAGPVHGRSGRPVGRGADRGPGGGGPGAVRGGRELPQLRRGGPPGGRATGRAEGGARHAGHRALLRRRHLRHGGAAPAGRAGLGEWAASGSVPCRPWAHYRS